MEIIPEAFSPLYPWAFIIVINSLDSPDNMLTNNALYPWRTSVGKDKHSLSIGLSIRSAKFKHERNAIMKGHVLLSDQTAKGTLEAQRALCPLVYRGLAEHWVGDEHSYVWWPFFHDAMVHSYSLLLARGLPLPEGHTCCQLTLWLLQDSRCMRVVFDWRSGMEWGQR